MKQFAIKLSWICFLIILSVSMSEAKIINKHNKLYTIDCNTQSVKFLKNNFVLNFTGEAKVQSQQHIYILQNLTDDDLYLNHSKKDPGAGAGWMSKLSQSYWSAIAVNEPNFNLSCQLMSPGKVEYKDCQSSLKVCELTNFTLPKKQNGTYWFSENSPLYELLDKVAARMTQTHVLSSATDSLETEN